MKISTILTLAAISLPMASTFACRVGTSEGCIPAVQPLSKCAQAKKIALEEGRPVPKCMPNLNRRKPGVPSPSAVQSFLNNEVIKQAKLKNEDQTFYISKVQQISAQEASVQTPNCVESNPNALAFFKATRSGGYSEINYVQKGIKKGQLVICQN